MLGSGPGTLVLCLHALFQGGDTLEGQRQASALLQGRSAECQQTLLLLPAGWLEGGELRVSSKLVTASVIFDLKSLATPAIIRAFSFAADEAVDWATLP